MVAGWDKIGAELALIAVVFRRNKMVLWKLVFSMVVLKIKKRFCSNYFHGGFSLKTSRLWGCECTAKKGGDVVSMKKSGFAAVNLCQRVTLRKRIQDVVSFCC
ncbi:unnamed protein product [Lathyrus sativus]|nr:unnamed protein product [Lathyrus sativus]